MYIVCSPPNKFMHQPPLPLITNIFQLFFLSCTIFHKRFFNCFVLSASMTITSVQQFIFAKHLSAKVTKLFRNFLNFELVVIKLHSICVLTFPSHKLYSTSAMVVINQVNRVHRHCITSLHIFTNYSLGGLLGTHMTTWDKAVGRWTSVHVKSRLVPDPQRNILTDLKLKQHL